MPELPEVEVSRRQVALAVKGRRVERLVVRDGRLRWPVAEDLASRIEGRRVREVGRRAKYLLFEVEGGCGQLVVHLGMSGSLRILKDEVLAEGGGGVPEAGKHDHVDLTFDNGAVVRYNDPRRFGSWRWRSLGEGEALNSNCQTEVKERGDDETRNREGADPSPTRPVSRRRRRSRIRVSAQDDEDDHQVSDINVKRKAPAVEDMFAKLGPEPLSADFNGEYLQRKAKRRRIAVKKFLMENSIVVGVGNIYSSESLFFAKVHPFKEADQLKEDEWIAVATNVKLVLEKSIAAGGTTLSDYSQPNGSAGYFVQQLAVYGREGEKCCDPACGAKVESARVGGRSTFWCPRCQPADGGD